MEETPWSNVPFEFREDIVYMTEPGEMRLDAYLPMVSAEDSTGRGLPSVAFIHGGAWIQGDKAQPLVRHCAWALMEGGYAVFSVGYTLSESTDHEAPWSTGRFPRNLIDCKNAIQYIRTHAGDFGIDPDRIAVAGASAGGHLALMVGLTGDDPAFQSMTAEPAVSTRVEAVINLFGVTDLRQWGGRFLVRDDSGEAHSLLLLASPILYVRPTSPPILTIHGTADPTVPYSHGQALDAAMEEVGVPHRLVTVEGGEHSFPFSPHPRNKQTDLRPDVMEFLNSHLATH